MNCIRVLIQFVRAVLKMVGITPQKVEIEPGTTMNFWAPTHKKKTDIRKSRPSVVLLHGFFSNGILTWIFQVLALSAAGKYDVYVPDLIFFGDSTTDKPERSVSFQAECVAKGLRKLGVEWCTVVGFSYGGFVGFKLAKLHPELVDSMVISGATCLKFDENMKNFVNMLLPESTDKLKLLISIGSHKKLFSSLPNFVYRDFLEAMYSHRKERAELLKACVDDEYFYPAEFPKKHHLLWGEKDRIINLDTAYHMKGQLGEEVCLEYIADAGHIVHLERPRLYNKHLKIILASFHDSNGAIRDDDIIGMYK